MALSTARVAGVRHVLNSTNVDPEGESQGIREDWIAEQYGAVASFGNLPTSGNWVGRRRWVSDIKAWATWDGAAWQVAPLLGMTGQAALVGASYDGVSPLIVYTNQQIASRTASGNWRWTLPAPVPNGILFASVSIVDNGNGFTAHPQHSGGNPASDLASVGISFYNAAGSSPGAGLIRINTMAIGW